MIKVKTLGLLFILVLIKFIASAQETQLLMTKRNEINIDVDLISVSISYNRQLHAKRFVGLGIGLGLSIKQALTLKRSTLLFPLLEIAHLRVINNYKLSENIDIETGLQGSFISWGGAGENEALVGGVVAAYLAPMLGFRNIKLGTCFFAGFLDLRLKYPIVYWTPLMLRFSVPL